ncbi:tubulin polyglutamylase TTLL4 [Trichuris trichiura]|uniref:Tubulin polyglutamylase TTLL4 n=1 Tax=Trichuris trichiura TaxID=36087 RepID=A0A077Z7U9_TRITR|nr:tubulin polyglutamylase TTLL4 [Trichuris trichiura]
MFELFVAVSVPEPNSNIRRKLLWCSSTLFPKIVKKMLIEHATEPWVGYWGQRHKVSDFVKLMPFQKVNHFPGNFLLGRKDRLCLSLDQMAKRWKKEEFGFAPETFILPRQRRALLARMKRNSGNCGVFILKPPSSSRGKGIRLTNKTWNIPEHKPLIVQRYITNPFLINGFKFDLRLYVLVSCWKPLRAYIYEEGIVRFASCKYTADVSSLHNQYVHLTNFSINKNAADLADVDLDSSELKWTLSQFWSYLSEKGIDNSTLVVKILDLVIKALISCESPINALMSKMMAASFMAYELYGFDILIDSELRPWLIEVNISPSVRCSNEVDCAVKTSLVQDVLNISGVQVPSDDLVLQAQTIDLSILNNLTSYDIRFLLDMEDEYDRRGKFAPIIPTFFSQYYLKYFRKVEYVNLLVAAWKERYSMNRDAGKPVAFVSRYYSAFIFRLRSFGKNWALPVETMVTQKLPIVATSGRRNRRFIPTGKSPPLSFAFEFCSLRDGMTTLCSLFCFFSVGIELIKK